MAGGGMVRFVPRCHHDLTPLPLACPHLTPVQLVNHQQVDEFGNTNRPAQPLNDRPLYYVLP